MSSQFLARNGSSDLISGEIEIQSKPSDVLSLLRARAKDRNAMHRFADFSYTFSIVAELVSQYKRLLMEASSVSRNSIKAPEGTDSPRRAMRSNQFSPSTDEPVDILA